MTAHPPAGLAVFDRGGLHPAAVLLAVLLHVAAGVFLLHWHRTLPPAIDAVAITLEPEPDPEPPAPVAQPAAAAPAAEPQAEPQPEQAAAPPPEPVAEPAEPSPAPPDPPLPVLATPKPAPEPPTPVETAPEDLPRPPPPPPSRRIAAPRPKPAPAQTAPTATSPTTTDAPPAAPAASAPPGPPPSIAVDWQGRLSAWLLAHRSYPEAARRRGEQGTVVVRFTVNQDGAVSSVLLVRGSGSTALDDAALSMLRGARVPPFPPSMPQPSVTVSVPIRYTLEP
ncbi:MAG: energy transducer TonB [Acetobacteraceae bacterium]